MGPAGMVRMVCVCVCVCVCAGGGHGRSFTRACACVRVGTLVYCAHQVRTHAHTYVYLRMHTAYSVPCALACSSTSPSTNAPRHARTCASACGAHQHAATPENRV